MPNAYARDQGRVLFTGCFTEFCERYSYYILQTLLIFFLIAKFGYTQSASETLVGTTIGIIYMSSIFGGFIAEKLLNHYIAALLGSIFMIGGTAVLAVSTTQNIMFFGLAFISLSTGLIKSNISSFIGDFYDKSQLSDSHRDFGFSVFYVGINIGSFSALFIASWLKQAYGFHAAFYSASISSVIMLIGLLLGIKRLRSYIAPIAWSISLFLKVIVVVAIYIALVFYMLRNPTLAEFIVALASVCAIAVLVASTKNKHLTNALVATLFFILSIIYWIVYFQQFISILLFIDHAVNHNLWGLVINTSQFLTADSIAILIFGSLAGRVWLHYGKIGRPIHDIDKFAIGFLFLIIACFVFLMGTIYGNVHHKVHAGFVILGLIALAFSEFGLSAIGLSLVTKIAPKGFVSLYMGIWLITIGIGGKIAGALAQVAPIPHHNVVLARTNMAHGLLIFSLVGIFGMALCLIVRKRIIAIKIAHPG